MLNEELCAPVHPEEWFQWVLDYVGWSLASIFGDILVQLGLKPGIFYIAIIISVEVYVRMALPLEFLGA